MLADDVVRGREDLPERRPAEDELPARGVVDAEGQVRLALADAREGERRSGVRDVLDEPRADAVDVDAGNRGHRIVHPPSIAKTCPVQ